MDVKIECICPPKADGEPRHEQDTVTLPEILGFREVRVIRQAIRLAFGGTRPSLAELSGLMSEQVVLHCIAAWTCEHDVTEKGRSHTEQLPLTRDSIETYLLPNYDAAEAVASAAEALYSEKVVLPLMVGASRSSKPSPINRPTSRRKSGSTSRSKRSKPSSITTTPMAVTGPMAASAGGVSNSWHT